MNLTRSELDVVLARMEEYPAGVGTWFWGYGPMEKQDEEGDGLDPTYFPAEVRMKYG